METQPLILSILADHALLVNGLKHSIMQRFGSAVQVSGFCDVHEFLKKVDKSTQVLVLDERVEGRDFGSLERQFGVLCPGARIIPNEGQRVITEVARLLRERLVPEAARVFELV